MSSPPPAAAGADEADKGSAGEDTKGWAGDPSLPALVSDSGSDSSLEYDTPPYAKSGIVELSTSDEEPTLTHDNVKDASRPVPEVMERHSDHEQLHAPAAEPNVPTNTASAEAEAGAMSAGRQSPQATAATAAGAMSAGRQSPQATAATAADAESDVGKVPDLDCPEVLPKHDLSDSDAAFFDEETVEDKVAQKVLDKTLDYLASNGANVDLSTDSSSEDEPVYQPPKSRRGGKNTSFEYSGGDTSVPFSTTIPSPQEVHRDLRQQKVSAVLRKREKQRRRKMRRGLKIDAAREMLREREMYLPSSQYHEDLVRDLEEVSDDVLEKWVMELENDSDASSGPERFHDANDGGLRIRDTEDYDGDDDDDVAARVTRNLRGHVTREVASLRTADEERKKAALKLKIETENYECSHLNSIQLEVLVSLWPVLANKLQPQKLLPLMYLCGGLTLQEATDVKRFCDEANSRKAASRLVLSIMRKKPAQLDTFFRIVNDQQPMLKKVIMATLHKHCGKYISEEVSALAFACGTHAPVTSRRSNEQNINEQMSEEKDPNQAGAEAKPEETAWRSVVRPNLSYLNSRLSAVEIADRCVEKELLTREEFDKILPKLAGLNQVDPLFRTLRQTGNAGYKVFIDVLRGFGDKYREVHHHLFHYEKKLKEEEKKKAEEKPQVDECAEEYVNNCPHICDPFLGRDEFVLSVLQTLNKMDSNSNRRILAIKGDLGTGKSSVVTAVAHRLLEDENCSVYYGPMRGLSVAPLVVQRIVHMISPRSTRDGFDALGDEISMLPDNCILILDNLEDCIYSTGTKSTQVFPTDIPLSTVIQQILNCHDTIKILLTTRFNVNFADTEVIYMLLPPLEQDVSITYMQSECPLLTHGECKELVQYAKGNPYAMQLLAVLSKYSKSSPEAIVKLAKERYIDMHIAYWTEADHILYILAELVVETLPKNLETAMAAFSIFHAPFTREAAVDLLTFPSPALIERHVLGYLRRFRLVDFDTMLQRFVMQPVVLKHGFATLEDHEHRAYRRTFVLHYFRNLQKMAATTPNTLEQLDYLQDQYRMDIPHYMRALRYNADVRDHELIDLLDLPVNLLFLVAPNDRVYRFVRRACSLAQSGGDNFLICANHLMLTFYHELAGAWNAALISLAAVFHTIVTQMRRSNVPASEIGPYHELLYFARHVERRFKLRLGVFSPDEARAAAESAYTEYHSKMAALSPYMLLIDVYTIACAGRWADVPTACMHLFESVRAVITDPTDESQPPVPEMLKHAVARYACDGMIVFIAYTMLALRDPAIRAAYESLVKLTVLVRKIGTLLGCFDQRDAANELTKSWHKMRYDYNASTAGIPFELLMFNIIRGRQFSSFPADPMIVGPATGLPDWLMCMDATQALRLYMETAYYSSEDAALQYESHMETLTEEERKVLVLLNRAYRHESDVLLPILENWERGFGESEAWMIVEIEGIPFTGMEVTSYCLLQAMKLTLDNNEEPASDDDLVYLMRFSRIANCCGQCLKYKSAKQKMNYCQRCTVVLYCDRTCQKKHYQRHKRVCARLNHVKKRAGV